MCVCVCFALVCCALRVDFIKSLRLTNTVIIIIIIKPMKEGGGGNRSTRRKPLATSFRKCHILFVEKYHQIAGLFGVSVHIRDTRVSCCFVST